MSSRIYKAMSAASGGTGAPAEQATGTGAAHTLLQLVHASQPLSIVQWEINFNGFAAGAPVICELCDTGTAGATVTAFTTNDLFCTNNYPDGSVAAGGGITLGGAASGFNASAEGTPAAPVHQFDIQNVAPSNQYTLQIPLDDELYLPVGHFLRIRVTNPGTSVGCYAAVKYRVG